ncbi:hypothetical protein GQ53DRAFT_828813 [Thozetella sp. PMI_491]|nr:hypothetical protein GQ53DRAFT_828813 [Thozetella sp. PMI_491]
MRLIHIFQLLVGSLAATARATDVHNGTFTPDHVLRVTSATIPVACESRLSVVVNGTSPGPAIRLTPGVATWIRVYNDMTDKNLTMASRSPSFPELGSAWASKN